MTSELIQGTSEWHALRSRSIGASDAAVILGISPYKTPYQLWEEKKGLREIVVTSSMQRGTDMEDPARWVFEELMGEPFFPTVLFHKEFPWMMASLDGMNMDGSKIVEIKCVNKDDHDLARQGIVPQHYYPQIQHQMEVSGMNMAYYFSYHPDSHYVVEVKRNNDFIEHMLIQEKQFNNFLINDESPPLCDRDYISRDDTEWKFSTNVLKEILLEKKRVKSREKEIRERLIELSEGKNSIGNGVKMTRYFRKGNVQYSHIPELIGVDLEPYRSPSIESWRIGECKNG